MGIKDGKITTDLYVKDTDRHQYLHYTSAHPYHTKKSVIFSQALRLSRLCTYEKDFKRHMAGMKQWFAKRDYPKDLIKTEMNKVKFPFVENKNNNKKEKGIPLVVTFHPSLGSILNKNYYLLRVNDEVKKVFSLRPMVSFRSARKLSSYLVRAKLYPVERKVGSKDVTVTLIDKTDPRDPTEREDYWIHTLKTKAPRGLNMEDGL